MLESTPERPSQGAEQVDRLGANVRRTTPHRLRRRLRGDLDTIVLTALRLDATRRYATAAELREDLLRHLEGWPVRARPDTWRYRGTRFLKRQARAALATIATVVLVAAAWLLARDDSSGTWARGPWSVSGRQTVPLATVAVEPFADSSERREGRDLARRVVARLRQNPDLRVVALPDSLPLQPGRAAELRETLAGVRHILRARALRREAGAVRVEAELAVLRSGEILWAGTLEGQAVDLVAKISTQVAAALLEPRIAFSSHRNQEQYDIFVMSAEGAGVRNLTPQSAARDANPAWSPDGRRIAFTSERESGGWMQIWVMNADGTGARNLTNHPSDNFVPTWSPNGTRIAFTSNRDTSLEIYAMNPNGDSLVRLTHHPANDLNPAWSPDGRKIAFYSDRETYELGIWVMNADGTGVQRLTIGGGGQDDVPAWSPDGQHIAFASIEGSQFDIFVINPDGSGLTRLTNTPYHERLPGWSPAGDEISFQGSRDGPRHEVYVMRADGRDVRRLTYFGGPNGNATWRPNLRRQKSLP